MSDAWLLEILNNSQPFSVDPIIMQVIQKVLSKIDDSNYPPDKRFIALGAAFDLVVSAEYYSTVTQNGWLYCDSFDSTLFYTYTNACPNCILNHEFVFHRAGKPRSGVIGSATSRLLGVFIESLVKRKHPQIEVFRGKEPVDIIFRDAKTLFVAEIKASPLMTLPLAVSTPTIAKENNQQVIHRSVDLPTLFDTNYQIFCRFGMKIRNTGNPIFMTLAQKKILTMFSGYIVVF
jgi:hypothetical protein